jgi:hypothetical protein
MNEHLAYEKPFWHLVYHLVLYNQTALFSGYCLRSGNLNLNPTQI